MMVKGPCVLCGDTDYMPSMGGPDICPSCDCGKFNKPEELKRLRDEAKDLRSAIERRDEIIDGLKSEVERLRGGIPDFRAQSKIAIAGQLANSAEVSRAINNMDQLTSIHIEENHGD